MSNTQKPNTMNALTLPAPSTYTNSDVLIAPLLCAALTQALTPDPTERAASFGRWWHDTLSGQWVLSPGAAELLHVAAGWHATTESCFGQLMPEDSALLAATLRPTDHIKKYTQEKTPCEFRVINDRIGLRWLRITPLTLAIKQTPLVSGIIVDITSARHAEIRERLSFELTQYLVGMDTLGEAVTKVIQLVCKNLGWEWGAYWAAEPDKNGVPMLACKYFWQDEQAGLSVFTQASRSLQLTSGEGLIGQIWQSGEARWLDNIVDDQFFLRYHSALESGLRSGYMFPVVYTRDDGLRHSPGVLEFYSTLSRQSEAQLPSLSVTIGTLIAQTALRHERQEAMRQLAQIDGLTELANRHYFYRTLDLACLTAEADGTAFGLMFIDLDRFKPVNDAFGHEAGNIVLREFAKRLQALTPPGSYVGRLGGDEFAILLHDGGSSCPLSEHLDILAKQVLMAARQPFLFHEHEMTVSASIGISLFPENGTTSPELLRSADSAMYSIKKNGRNALSFFSNSTSDTLAAQQSDLTRRLTMEMEMHQALAEDQFFLEYQPIFDQSGYHIHAVEALIRWRRPSGEIVRPDVFIPLAEQSRLIVHIGRWVVRQACHDLSRLNRAGLTTVQMHVNMAASEFTSENLADQLSDVILDSGIAPRHLCLELTESMLMQQADKVIPVMHTLRQLGIGISLDDFGMGYSSLSLLKNLPISSMKIDRSFVRGLPHHHEDCAIARTVIELGRNLHLDVIAEGVETTEQLEFLRQYGCTLIQGFVLSRPQAIEKLITAYGNQSGQKTHE